MKTKIIITAIILVCFSLLTYSQPLPPSSPTGNPIPVGGFAFLFLAIGGIYLFFKKKNE